MKVLGLILLWTALTLVNAQEPQCNNSLPYPPDWPQNCIDAYDAHARNVSSFTPGDRRALIHYLNVVCGDCHNSFIDRRIRCGIYDETTGEFWRRTFCLRDDNNEYCRVVIFDIFANTTLSNEYVTECNSLISGLTNCSSSCQNVLIRTQNYLGCCTRFLWASADEYQARYGTCVRNGIIRQCGGAETAGYAHATYGHSGFILTALAIAFSFMTVV